MRRSVAVIATAAGLFLLPCVAPAQAVTISHDGIGCIQADRFPQFFARFDPSDAVSRAQLHFRPAGWPHWYSVPMKQEGYNFVGVLPKPEKSLTKIDYYISATDRSFGESSSEEYNPDVVSGPAACQQKKILAAALSRAQSVVVSPPEGIAGLPKVPAGFSSDGVVAGASSSSSAAQAVAAAGGGGATTAATVVAAGAAGGGIGTTALVLGGVAVAGGAAAVVATKGGGSSAPPTTMVPCPACYAGNWVFTATLVTAGGLCGPPEPQVTLNFTVNPDGTFKFPSDPGANDCSPPGTIDASGNVRFTLAGDTCPGSAPGLTCPAGTGTGRCSSTTSCSGTLSQSDQYNWVMTR